MAMNELTRLVQEDMKPALGVTEPGAIAFAAATAGSYIKGPIKKVRIKLNSGMFKNAFTCGIPGSVHSGAAHAAALGVVAARKEYGLESLKDVTPEDDRIAEKLIEDGIIQVELETVSSRIDIKASVRTDDEECEVFIRDEHTNIVKIVKDGKIIFVAEEKPESVERNTEQSLIHTYTLKALLEYVRTVPAEEIEFIHDAFLMNLDLLKEGLDSPKTEIGRELLKENGGEIFSQDILKTAQLLCSGAIEARVLGMFKPAMSITGSGAHGIIATMPVYAFFKAAGTVRTEEMLHRSVLLSFLITMYIKEYSGKLSAFCGCAIAAGTGAACGLAFMRGADEEQLAKVIRNMASGITGMICDGGNAGCVMKGITAVDSAFRSVSLAMKGIAIEAAHGINGNTPEETMRNMGRIACPGMEETEKVIVEIMKEKKEGRDNG